MPLEGLTIDLKNDQTLNNLEKERKKMFLEFKNRDVRNLKDYLGKEYDDLKKGEYGVYMTELVETVFKQFGLLEVLANLIRHANKHLSERKDEKSIVDDIKAEFASCPLPLFSDINIGPPLAKLMDGLDITARIKTQLEVSAQAEESKKRKASEVTSKSKPSSNKKMKTREKEKDQHISIKPTEIKAIRKYGIYFEKHIRNNISVPYLTKSLYKKESKDQFITTCGGLMDGEYLKNTCLKDFGSLKDLGKAIHGQMVNTMIAANDALTLMWSIGTGISVRRCDDEEKYRKESGLSDYERMLFYVPCTSYFNVSEKMKRCVRYVLMNIGVFLRRELDMGVSIALNTYPGTSLFYFYRGFIGKDELGIPTAPLMSVKHPIIQVTRNHEYSSTQGGSGLHQSNTSGSLLDLVSSSIGGGVNLGGNKAHSSSDNSKKEEKEVEGFVFYKHLPASDTSINAFSGLFFIKTLMKQYSDRELKYNTNDKSLTVPKRTKNDETAYANTLVDTRNSTTACKPTTNSTDGEEIPVVDSSEEVVKYKGKTFRKLSDLSGEEVEGWDYKDRYVVLALLYRLNVKDDQAKEVDLYEDLYIDGQTVYKKENYLVEKTSRLIKEGKFDEVEKLAKELSEKAKRAKELSEKVEREESDWNTMNVEYTDATVTIVLDGTRYQSINDINSDNTLYPSAKTSLLAILYTYKTTIEKIGEDIIEINNILVYKQHWHIINEEGFKMIENEIQRDSKNSNKDKTLKKLETIREEHMLE
jgi:hypothetical protein